MTIYHRKKKIKDKRMVAALVKFSAAAILAILMFLFENQCFVFAQCGIKNKAE